MSKFKVGDKVRYVKHYDSHIDSKYFEIGKEYTVSREISYNSNRVYVDCIEVYVHGYQLELVEDRPDDTSPKKLDDGKPRTDLIRPEFILALAESLKYGADKYDEKVGEVPNYLKGDGFNYSRIYGSLQRHLNQWYSGENHDPESKLHHLQLAAANIMFLLTYELSEDKGVDDRVVL